MNSLQANAMVKDNSPIDREIGDLTDVCRDLLELAQNLEGALDLVLRPQPPAVGNTMALAVPVGESPLVEVLQSRSRQLRELRDVLLNLRGRLTL